MSVTIQNLLDRVNIFKNKTGRFSISKTDWWSFITDLINKVKEVQDSYSAGLSEEQLAKIGNLPDNTTEDLAGKAGTDHTHESLNISLTPTLTLEGIEKGVPLENKTPQQMWEALVAPYVAPVLSSISISPGATVEVGTTITILSAALSWVNDSEGTPPQSVAISNVGFPAINLAGSPQTINAEEGTTKQRATAGYEEWRLTAEDKNGSALSSKYDRVYWYFRRFFGASAIEVTDNASAQTLIEALQQNWLDSNRAGTVTCQSVNADGANYTYIAYADSLGGLSGIIMNGATPVLAAFSLVGTFDYTNAVGHTESYKIYKSNAKGAFSNGDSLVIS